ncbi:hypothetical protein MKX01_004175 [Papaver californicum]|nr:hypothetical protein MKX01_004175 [Papaver californicum]
MGSLEEDSSSTAAIACSQSRSSNPSEEGIHYLAKCVLPRSAVLHAVYGHLRSSSSFDIVFGKETSVELVIVGEDGVVQSVCEQTVFGIIKDLAILRRSEKEPGKDLLVVLSDSGKLSFLKFCNEMHRFFPVSHFQLSNPGNSRHQLGHMLAVDNHGCFVAVSAFEERLALFSVSMLDDSSIIDKNIFYPPESEGDIPTAVQDVQGANISGTIWSMCFISKDVSQSSKGEKNATLAIVLNRKGAALNELVLLEWDTHENAVHVISQYIEAESLAMNIVEVPYSYGFAVLFRVGDALLMDLSDPHNPCCVHKIGFGLLPIEDSVDDDVAVRALLELGMEMSKGDDPMSIDNENGQGNSLSKSMCSWSWEPGHNSNPMMFVSLDTGELLTLEISFESDISKMNLSEPLYKCLPCKTLLWVKGDFVVALTEMGDGIVLQFEEGKLSYMSPVQNITPVLDSVVDYHNGKHDQMFACCGVAPEGSLRIIRSGISVENLLRTAPIYQGITGTWTLRMKVLDSFDSFLVLSFVEETRVLSVGLSFSDVTDAVGFQPDACTLACGLVGDGLLVQIHRNAVRLCLPTTIAHPEGIPLSAPICTSWFPDNVNISLGAVGQNMIIVATSNPCFLFILGARTLSAYHYEIYEMQHVRLQNEVSSISIPQRISKYKSSTSVVSLPNISKPGFGLPIGVEISDTFVIGTHRPAVEILSFVPEEGLRIVASGIISLNNMLGTVISGCVPQDVRLVLVDRLYVLSGLRNGMLLRFEWPNMSTLSPPLVLSQQRPFVISNLVTSFVSPSSSNEQCRDSNIPEKAEKTPIYLELIAIRRIGVTPVFLVPLCDSLDSDIIALSDRPWLLQTAKHSLSFTSISFQPATHVTPVCSVDCPKGILFVAENRLHLVEMIHSKRLNVQNFCLGGTPRKVVYHSESRLLLVMRTELSGDSCSSDICCVDPHSGSLLSSFKLEPGETGKSMQLVKVGDDRVLVVGTNRFGGRAIMHTGEAESSKGRLLVLCVEHKLNSVNSSFREIVGYATEQLSSSSLCSSPEYNGFEGVKLEETDVWQLVLAYQTIIPGVVLAVCPYLDRYFLASAGNFFYLYGFVNENPQRVRRLAYARTRFTITCLASQSTRIVVGDCRDGVLFYSYDEEPRRLKQLYCDPVQRLVADCILMDMDTAVVSDRKGNLTVLSCPKRVEDNASPECNLTLSCSYYIGETAMSIRKGSYSYKLPVDDTLEGCDVADTILNSSHNSIVASTMLGSVMIFIAISREEFELLKAVQDRLIIHPLTAPILGNDHNEFRGRGSTAGVSKMLDGDMLTQFLELTSSQQDSVLAVPLGLKETGASISMPPHKSISVNQVVRLLERVHYALN